jgi:hypothetical protein
VRTHANLKLEQCLELYETGMLPWDIEMTVEDPLSDDEDGVPECEGSEKRPAKHFFSSVSSQERDGRFDSWSEGRFDLWSEVIWNSPDPLISYSDRWCEVVSSF